MKILLLGDAGVGKTSLINKYVHGKFKQEYKMTIGMEPYSRYLKIDGEKVTLSIWDIGGQDRFRKMRGMFYRGAVGSLLVFDLTRTASFENTKNWAKEAKDESPGQKLILVGNKNDLDDYREVTTEKGRELAEEIGAVDYFETSAKDGNNVAKSFKELGRVILAEY